MGDNIDWNNKFIKKVTLSFTEGESQYDAGTIEIRNVNEKW